jgi:hypothetical protein
MKQVRGRANQLGECPASNQLKHLGGEFFAVKALLSPTPPERDPVWAMSYPLDTSGFLWKPFLKVDRVDRPEKKTPRSHLSPTLHLTV